MLHHHAQPPIVLSEQNRGAIVCDVQMHPYRPYSLVFNLVMLVGYKLVSYILFFSVTEEFPESSLYTLQ
jgi:hypothetical protein